MEDEQRRCEACARVRRMDGWRGDRFCVSVNGDVASSDSAGSDSSGGCGGEGGCQAWRMFDLVGKRKRRGWSRRCARMSSAKSRWATPRHACRLQAHRARCHTRVAHRTHHDIRSADRHVCARRTKLARGAPIGCAGSGCEATHVGHGRNVRCSVCGDARRARSVPLPTPTPPAVNARTHARTHAHPPQSRFHAGGALYRDCRQRAAREADRAAKMRARQKIGEATANAAAEQAAHDEEVSRLAELPPIACASTRAQPKCRPRVGVRLRGGTKRSMSGNSRSVSPLGAAPILARSDTHCPALSEPGFDGPGRTARLRCLCHRRTRTRSARSSSATESYADAPPLPHAAGLRV